MENFSPENIPANQEYLKKIGEFSSYGSAYQNLIKNILHTSTEDMQHTDEEEKIFFSKLESSVSSALLKNQDEFEKNNLDKAKLLCEPSSMKEKAILIEEAKDSIHMDNPTAGVFVLRIDSRFLHKIKPTAQAFAYVGEGVNFIAVAEHPEEKYKELNKKRYEQNVPHELSHIIWKEVKENNLLKNTETEKDLFEAFEMFRNEMVARISGGQAAMGYASPGSAEEIDEGSDDKWYRKEHITKWVGSLNEILFEEIAPLLRSLKISQNVLVGICIKSQSFEELKKHLVEYLKYLEKQSENLQIENKTIEDQGLYPLSDIEYN